MGSASELARAQPLSAPRIGCLDLDIGDASFNDSLQLVVTVREAIFNECRP